MIQPPPQSDRRTRAHGVTPRGVTPPSCKLHAGFRAGACIRCAAGPVPLVPGQVQAMRRIPPSTTAGARARRIAAEQQVAQRAQAQRDAPPPVRAPEPPVEPRRAPKAGQPIRVKVAKAARRSPKPSKSGRPRPITYLGRTQTAQAWAREYGLTAHAVRMRVRRGTPLAVVIPQRGPWTGARWDYALDCEVAS